MGPHADTHRMPNFALKAAVIEYDQLAARATALAEMDLSVRLELHTFGSRDIDDDASRRVARDNVARLRDHHAIESLVVHVPLQSVAVVTKQAFDFEQCARAIEFADAIDAAGVVIHRYYALVHGDDPVRVECRQDAVHGFEQIVLRLARLLGPRRRLLVENVGHYSLLPRDGRSYLSGPLDHFFPWEIQRFRDFLTAENLTAVEPFVDVAHATLSANLFNRRRADPHGTRDDARFRWIDDDDLAHAAWLNPLDFVDPAMSYLHVSDAIQLDREECAAPLDEARLTQAIVTEGLELGLGTLQLSDLPGRFGRTGDLVLEVDPGACESHVRNAAQTRSLTTLRDVFAP